MEKQEIIEHVIKIVKEEFVVDKVTAESKFKIDLNFDSLDCVEFVMEIEDRFNVSMPDEEVEPYYNKTIADFAEYLKGKL